MSKPTDAPPRPKLQVETEPVSPLVASPEASLALPAADDHGLTQESFRAILSSHQRAGRWEAADEIEVRAICGDVTLDFTHADLPPSGMIEIDVWAIGGHVRIIVPDGAEVELDGTPVLGSIEQKFRKKGVGGRVREWVTGESDEVSRPAQSAQPPYFRVDARAICGVVEVTGR